MMIRKYFAVSWRVTIDNIFVFIQIAVLLSVATTGLMKFPVFGFLVIIAGILLLPTLVTGLERIYLKAIRGEPAGIKDVIYGRKKIKSLIGVGLLIGIDSLGIGFLFGLVYALIIFVSSLIIDRTGSPAITGIGIFIQGLISIGFFVVLYWRESQFIHAPNLIVEKDFTARDAMRNSKRLVKKSYFSFIPCLLL